MARAAEVWHIIKERVCADALEIGGAYSVTLTRPASVTRRA